MKPSGSDLRELRSKIESSYVRWGVPAELLQAGKTTTPDSFVKLLEAIEDRIPKMNCRVMPSSFNPNDKNMKAFPYYLTPRWDSCERALRAFGAHGVMSRLPLFWQIESNLHAACRRVGAFIFLNEPENMPVGAMALKMAEINIVVTDANDAFAFSSYLTENKFSGNPAWIIIHALTNEAGKLPNALLGKDVRVAQEVHVFPGVPVFEQCKTLFEEKSPRFHVCGDFIAETAENGVSLTSAVDHPLPLFRYELPITVKESGQCDCGKTIFNIEV